MLEAVASMLSGYLFVINNYLPMIISLICVIISTILSFKFRDIYKVRKKDNIKAKDLIYQYKKDFKVCFKFIFRSNRFKALVIFSMVFYSTIKIIDVYRSDLLVDIGIPEQQFSMIYAMLSLIGCISVSLKQTIEKKFKNRTLTFISLMYVGACLIIGCIMTKLKGFDITIPIILIMYIIQKISTSIWWVLEAKYIKNFTKEQTRNKLTFAYEFISSIAGCIASVLAGLLLKVTNIETAFLIVGLISLIAIVNALEYMRTRIGLKPEDYSKQDLEFEKVEK